MREFFLFETDYPAGSGFALFQLTHVLWLVFWVVVWSSATVFYCRLEEDNRRRAERMLGTILPVTGIYRDVVLTVTGHFDRGFLPLHLCSMALWIALFFVWTRSRGVGVIYLLLCVPGAVCALLFPDWNMYPFLNYMHIHAFLSHGGIVLLGVWIFVSGQICLRWRDFLTVLLFGVVGTPVIYALNQLFHTNYWFVNHASPDSPLEWIADVCGRWYPLCYLLSCFLVIAIWQAALMFLQKRLGMGSGNQA